MKEQNPAYDLSRGHRKIIVQDSGDNPLLEFARYVERGCLAYDGESPSSHPLAFAHLREARAAIEKATKTLIYSLKTPFYETVTNAP